MVFLNLHTGASVGYELMHGNVSAYLFITTNADLPGAERVLFWVGGADENGVQPITLANRALVEGPLATSVFPADHQVGALQTVVR
ncbi:hypothetical protein [Parafrankia sp. FMc2]|uniref:hypothetical protein n=1 Tax=Parafrankia sp. FMc2 TaxID=3233196 RepID=UPI0034D777F1